MKIFFIQADQQSQIELVFPIGISYVATMAKLHGHEIEVFDPNIEANKEDALRQRLKGFNPDIIALSLRNIDSQHTRKLVYYLEFLRPQVDLIKSVMPDKRMVIGGSGFSLFAQRIMEIFPEFDYGVYLEAEESFPELLGNLDHPERVKGLFYRTDGEILFTGNRKMPDFSSLPRPDRGLLKVERYRISGKSSMGVQSKRGCILHCAYCTYPFLNGREIRMRDPIDVVDEIEELQDRWGFDKFMFVDSVFNIPESHAEAICREMIRRRLHIRWFAYFNEANISEGFVRLAMQAGCDTFLFSPDGYSDVALKSLRKDIGVEDINKLFKLMRRIKGARIGVSFFRTPPGQDMLTFFRILLLYLKAKLTLRERLVGFGLVPIRIEPGTRIMEIACAENLCSPETDLVKPVFYQYRPARHIETVLSALVKFRNLLKRVSKRGKREEENA